MSVADLINQGYGGYAGWGEAEAEADFAATGGSGKWSGGGGGGNEYADIESVPSVQGYVKGQFAAEDPALKDLIMGMRAREDPLDIYKKLETEAGLPALRGTAATLTKEIGNIEDYLEQIEPDITARTRESLVTESQRRGMVGAERKPYLEKLSKFSTNLGRIGQLIGAAERGISTKTELAMRGQEMGLEPFQFQYSVMVNRNARLLTGFTEDRKTKLDMLWDKLQRTRQLDDREWELASTLSSQETEYLRNLQSAAAQAGADITGKESADELLALIGLTAKEAIDWERGMEERKLAKIGAGKVATATAKRDLLDDAAKGATLPNLQRKYGDKLSTSDIVELYTGAGFYGPPEEPYAQEILGTEAGGDDEKSSAQYWVNKGYSYDDAMMMAALNQ